MAAPLIFVSTFRVKDGDLEGLKGYYRRVLGIVEANEPRAIAFHGFLSEDGTELTSIQVHPDAASFEFHLQVLRDNWEDSFSQYASMMEGYRIDYYGATPPESALAMDREMGIDPGVKPIHIAGFTRAQTS